MDVLSIIVGYANTRKRKQPLPNPQQDTSCKDGVVLLQMCCVLAVASSLCSFTGENHNIRKRHKYIHDHDHRRGCSPDLSVCKFQIPALARLTLELIKNSVSSAVKTSILPVVSESIYFIAPNISKSISLSVNKTQKEAISVLLRNTEERNVSEG